MMSPGLETASVIAMIGLSTALTNWMNDRRAAKQNVKIQETANVAANTAEVTAKIHTLVNSQFGEQLKINVVSAQALYDTTNNPVHLALLTEAKRRLKDHEEKQETVDSGHAT
jgi:hypothetical protein